MLDTVLTLIILSILILAAVYEFQKKQKRNREINRAVDEMNDRKAAVEETRRIYEESYQREGKALKKRVLDNIKATACGDKIRFDSEALEAVKALQRRQGEHPETIAAWAPLIRDLSAAAFLEPKALHRRLAT